MVFIDYFICPNFIDFEIQIITVIPILDLVYYLAIFDPRVVFSLDQMPTLLFVIATVTLQMLVGLAFYLTAVFVDHLVEEYS